MTISVTDTALEKKTIKHYTRRNRLHSCCEDDMNHNRSISWLTWIYCGIFLMSFAGFYTFWYTETFSDFVISRMELRNGTRAFDWWQHPPIKLEYRIHIFNYTNVKEFEAGTASKLRVQELGPYIYQEIKDRVNVEMHENGTATFQEKKSYAWIGGRPDNDTIVVPNVPLMFATAFVRDLNFAVRFFLNTMLSSLQEHSFINEMAGNFIWGYENKFFDMVKPLILFKRDLPFDKFGMLVEKNGISKDRITINTKSRDIGLIDRVNGMNKRKIWDDEKCDRIMSSDGNIFPPYLLKDTNKTIYMFSQEMCRDLPFRFTKQITTFNIPSLRYKFTPDAFNFSNTQNKCFCPKINGLRVCPPTGLFNISVCNDNIPLLLSFPHFYGADKILLEQVDGLNPRQKDHESYMDLHPRIAIPMAGWTRLQINLEVRKAIAVPFLGNLKDGTILPLFWMEIGIDELPESMLEMFRSAYFTATNMEMALQWCSLITMILSLSVLIIYLWKYHVQQNKILPKKSFV